MFKNFNIQAFCLKLLPPILRKDRILAFLRVLLSPLESILARWILTSACRTILSRYILKNFSTTFSMPQKEEYI